MRCVGSLDDVGYGVGHTLSKIASDWKLLRSDFEMKDVLYGRAI